MFFVGSICLYRPVCSIKTACNLNLYRQFTSIGNLDFPGAYFVPAGNVATPVESIVFRLEIHQLRLNVDQSCRAKIQLNLFIHRNIFYACPAYV